MLSLTQSGTVTRKKGNTLTIILKGGRKVSTDASKYQLQVGQKCHVAFNDADDKVTQVYCNNEESTRSEWYDDGVKLLSKEEIRQSQEHPLEE